MHNVPPINAERLWHRLMTLSSFTRSDVPWTRRAFSTEFLQARAWLQAEFATAGLKVALDAGGNLTGRCEGTQAALQPLVTGSHCDTVAGGGRFDGILGVIAGLEVMQSLREAGCRLRHPVELIDFLSEEPSDFGISCVGSRAFSGQLDPSMLTTTDGAGETLADAMLRIGARPQALVQERRGPGDIAAFVELHIEQGPVLEHERLPIGVVSHIVGIRRVELTVTGQPDHAGTTPMDMRRDALLGAALLIAAAQRQASAMNGGPHYLVATIGRLGLTPNAANAVPGTVVMTLEVRSDCERVLLDFPERLLTSCRNELDALRVHASAAPLTTTRPTRCAPLVMEAIERASDRLGLAHRRLPSGAGHDAMYLASTGPMGMIFVPCRGGRSHCPEEWIAPDQAAAGARVLAATILELDDAC
ncbi:Zn-dependent hydrolase [Pseudorhodoferax sp. Leaf274]|uniref:Zn-dependent hydrolase n=1 Tax=Pseudorhodoferax sp. Leaf274 TaxID=1736318 RepID=UPI000702F22D|nr:Zn-dependent hydrolase [Pseudorhodoferax sp. Leaf274]KQP49070.1 Zn-dependent hydrolase [Pseudorhodoferax sp. Leaf274]